MKGTENWSGIHRCILIFLHTITLLSRIGWIWGMVFMVLLGGFCIESGEKNSQ